MKPGGETKFKCFQCQSPLSASMAHCPGCGIVFPQPVPDSPPSFMDQAALVAAKSYELAKAAHQIARQGYAMIRAAPPELPPIPALTECFLCRGADIQRVRGIVS